LSDRAAMERAVAPQLFGRAGYTARMRGDCVETLGPVRLEVEHRSPGPAGGPTLRVRGAADGREWLRFDCFAHEAHWHLDPDGSDEITPIPLAVDSLEWTLAELRRDLAGYLAKAGLTDALPDPAAALARVEAALRNPPARLEQLSEAVLRQRSGEKWHFYPSDVLALWVADMDYPTAEPIRRRLQRVVREAGVQHEAALAVEPQLEQAQEPRVVDVEAELARDVGKVAAAVGDEEGGVVLEDQLRKVGGDARGEDVVVLPDDEVVARARLAHAARERAHARR